MPPKATEKTLTKSVKSALIGKVPKAPKAPKEPKPDTLSKQLEKHIMSIGTRLATIEKGMPKKKERAPRAPISEEKKTALCERLVKAREVRAANKAAAAKDQ